MEDSAADRPEQKSGEASAPPATDHQELRVGRYLFKDSGGLAAHRRGRDLDVGVLVLPSGQHLGEEELLVLRDLGPLSF
jgi:hypothetical protein